ncbi:MAG: NAD(P)H-dependent oxidoreductase [Pseudomonadota bacterium]
MSQSTILAFAASNSAASINAQLVLHAAETLRDEMGADITIETLDLADFDMPVYSPERQAAGIPAEAHAFYDRLGAADGLMISFAEYNGNYTAAFKNVFDWCSRIKMQIYQDKPLFLMATSPGRGGGQNVLRIASEAAPFFGGKLAGTFNFGPFAEHFDAEGAGVTTPELKRELRNQLSSFYDAVKAQR